MVKCQIVREGPNPHGGRSINSPEELVEVFRAAYGEPSQEHLIAFYLDGQHQVLDHAVIGIGTVDMCVCKVVDIIRPAVLLPAAAIILMHNHPSGIPRPSTEDIQLTQQVGEACKMMGLRLLDHIVIGTNSHVSLKTMAGEDSHEDAAF